MSNEAIGHVVDGPRVQEFVFVRGFMYRMEFCHESGQHTVVNRWFPARGRVFNWMRWTKEQFCRDGGWNFRAVHRWREWRPVGPPSAIHERHWDFDPQSSLADSSSSDE